jgi:hypothetical protein
VQRQRVILHFELVLPFPERFPVVAMHSIMQSDFNNKTKTREREGERIENEM